MNEDSKRSILQANTTKSAFDDFRNYNDEIVEQRVLDHYRDMRTHQTVAFYYRMAEKYTFANERCRRKMTVEEAFDELEHYVVRIGV